MQSTPQSLLQRLRTTPDAESWERLVKLYTPWLERVLRRAAVPEPDIADLRQDVLAVLVRELPAFEHSGQPGAFRRWLRGVVTHRMLGYWRSRREHLPLDNTRSDNSAAGVNNLEALWEAEHDRFLARQILEQSERLFTRTTWTAFRRQVLDGARAAEVAAELGLSVNAVLLAKSRVLRRLRLEAGGLIEDA